MRKYIYSCLTIILVAGIAKAVPIQWKIEDGGNDHFYEKVVIPGISWNDAKVAAELAGGYLATITSAEEQAFINTYEAVS